MFEPSPARSSLEHRLQLAGSADGARTDWNLRQPILADEIQTFKALITVHKVLQEGHPVVVKEAQQNVNWVESLARGVNGEGLRGMRCQEGCNVVGRKNRATSFIR
jgi:ANTH domain